MIYLQLFYIFAKIAIFAFGGGYACLPIVQSELIGMGWCTEEQFADVVALAQMTPGPIVINAATYVGKIMAGVPGGIIATLGFVTPAVLLTAAISLLSAKLSDVVFMKKILRGIRAGVVGLILCAVIFFLRTSVVDRNFHVNIPAVFILIMNIIFIKKFRLNIYVSLIISVIIGTPLMYIWSLNWIV